MSRHARYIGRVGDAGWIDDRGLQRRAFPRGHGQRKYEVLSHAAEHDALAQRAGVGRQIQTFRLGAELDAVNETCHEKILSLEVLKILKK